MLLAESVKRGYGIAAFCRRLVSFALGVLIHFLGKLALDLACISAKHVCGKFYLFGVFLGRDLARTYTAAASYLIVHTGTLLAYILGKFSLARGQSQRPREHIYDRIYG